jgi:hypothetical protein
MIISYFAFILYRRPLCRFNAILPVSAVSRDRILVSLAVSIGGLGTDYFNVIRIIASGLFRCVPPRGSGCISVHLIDLVGLGAETDGGSRKPKPGADLVTEPLAFLVVVAPFTPPPLVIAIVCPYNLALPI